MSPDERRQRLPLIAESLDRVPAGLVATGFELARLWHWGGTAARPAA